MDRDDTIYLSREESALVWAWLVQTFPEVRETARNVQRYCRERGKETTNG